MKNIFKLLIILTIISTASCRKDYYGQKPIPPGPVSFNKDILPILVASCAKSGCHSGTQSPNLTAPVAYDNLQSFVSPDDSLAPDKSVLYQHLTGGLKIMPPDGKLNSYDLQLIYQWIKQGDQNN